MFLIENYGLAICAYVFCMLCWGSWSNTQKLAEKTWRFELFYWDFILGLVLTAFLWGITAGSLGGQGIAFIADLKQAEGSSVFNAILGGIIWNLGNLVFVAAIALAGMSVAFPIGGGIGWVGGIIFNYFLEVKGGVKLENLPRNMLWIGVVLIFIAIALSMLAYNRRSIQQRKPSALGIILAVLSGFGFAFFYGFVVKSLDPGLVDGGQGNLGPYSGSFLFTVGALVTTIIVHPFFMRRPVEGAPVTMKQYFSGTLRTHLTGVLGGFIWASGLVVSFMAVGSGNPAISYALSNAAPVVAILWGVLVWKEFKDAPKGTNKILTVMFCLFIAALVIITASKVM